MARSSKKRTASQQGPKQGSRATWKVFDRGAKVAAAVVATQAAGLTWRAATGRKPPTSSEVRNPDLKTAEAVAWAALAGATVELSKVIINRRATNYWLKSTGHLPPGMKALPAADTKESPPR